MLRKIWKAAPVATTILFAALAVSVFFAVRIGANWIYWNDPAHRDQHIAGWMTPRYVAHSWNLPPEVIAEAISLQPGEGRPASLDRIADERGIPVEELIRILENAIARHRDALGTGQ